LSTRTPVVRKKSVP